MRIHPEGLRGKLILIFVVIKVVPLILLATLAWWAAQRLGDVLGERVAKMTDEMLVTMRQSGEGMTRDAIRAQDERARESLERLTTDTARAVAAFLYDRDSDIRQAAQLAPDEAAYREFLRNRQRDLLVHGDWQLAADATHWEMSPAERSLFAGVENPALAADPVQALTDNARDFHSRPPDYLGHRVSRPLYVEMSFVDLQGVERVKAVTGDLTSPRLHNVKNPANTFVRAEHYWSALQALKPGEIYVSDVIGAYVPSHVIGIYTPAAARKAGIPFAPEQSAYAGVENPRGRHFRGIIRWATPVLRQGKLIGYVTLALDHDHLRQFTDRISPTDGRYTPIADAAAGNYAFMWDHDSRAISHPRDYMLPGYDPQTGDPVVPWLDTQLYDEWKSSGLPWKDFVPSVPAFRDQSLKRQPAAAQIKAGTLGLDCRYLNFSPQCAGWNQLTAQGGSGSFVIYFSGLWKLSTAAAIPYFTGQYGDSPRGFGFVTIGANVDDFHRAATQSARVIARTLDEKGRTFVQERAGMEQAIDTMQGETTLSLAMSTLLMIAVVIAVAIWMANFLTAQITDLIAGIRRIESGDLAHRLAVRSRDEMGQLAVSLNLMADSVQESFARSEEARARAEEANQLKSDFLANVSHELRTPLNGILGFAELLEMEAANPTQREYAITIKNSGHHLLGIVNDLLDLAKIEAGRLELHPCEVLLEEFVRDIVGLHGAQARAKGVEMRLELGEGLPATVWADPLRLRQLLNNLVHNAVKFTDHGHVCLRVALDARGVRFEVEDTGCGIAPEMQALVFEKFRQAGDGQRRTREGTGLGLSLARELAILMGGEIMLRSEIGQGSLFTLVIPLTGGTVEDAADAE